MYDPAVNLLLHGSPEPLSDQIQLRAGPLTLLLETGDLRYISLAGREVVRRVYGAVRDRHWATVPGRLSDVTVAREHDWFDVTYRSEHRQDEIDFIWRAEIVGRPDGTITFAFAGEARSTFARNRIGLCVLHPMRECAGTGAVLRRRDGTQLDVRFPELVAIEQPIAGFCDLGTLAYDGGEGVRLELTFDGDAFETEDQRNWIDASFKTYGTPLSLPRPVTIVRGTTVEQRVTLRLRADGRESVGSSRPTRAAAGGNDRALRIMPSVGIGGQGVAPLGAGSQPILALVRELKPAHVRVDLSLSSSGWERALERAVALEQSLGCRLELALHVAPACGDAVALLAALLPERVRVARLLVFSEGRPTTTAAGLTLVRDRLLATRPHLAPAGVGSLADLYEFHLYPPPPADLICWSMNPHAHASDLTSLAETPPAACEQVRTVRQRHPGAFVAVSPITLTPRRRESGSGETHPLHASLFGAAWTLAVAIHLAKAGAGSATFFDGVRELGRPDHVSPLFHVLCDVCSCAGGKVMRAEDGPHDIASLLVRLDSGAVLLLANLSRHTRAVPIHSDFVPARVRVLDESTARLAVTDRHGFRSGMRPPAGNASIELAPFATARLDGHLRDER